MTFYVRENKKINLYSINIDIYKLSILKSTINSWDDKGFLRNRKNISGPGLFCRCNAASAEGRTASSTG